MSEADYVIVFLHRGVLVAQYFAMAFTTTTMSRDSLVLDVTVVTMRKPSRLAETFATAPATRQHIGFKST